MNCIRDQFTVSDTVASTFIGDDTSWFITKNLIKVKSIAITLMPAPKSPSVFITEFDTPQSNRLVADRDTTLGHKILDIAKADAEAMTQPDNVLNNRRRKTLPFVHRCGSIHLSIVAQASLSSQYPYSAWRGGRPAPSRITGPLPFAANLSPWLYIGQFFIDKQPQPIQPVRESRKRSR